MNFMRANFALVAILALSVAGSAQESQFPANSSDPVINDCKLMVVEDIEVPAQQAGVLTHLGVKLGSRVSADEEMGKIDDDEAQMQLRVAKYAADAAFARATDEIEVTYSKAAAKVAKADLEMLEATNEQAKGAVVDTEIRRARLDAERSVLAIDKALHDQKLAKFDFYKSKAEVEAAEMKLDKLIIRAPFGGEIVDMLRHQGEWVNPGDPIVRLVQLDTLYVEGNLNIAEHDPREVLGCEVTVEVQVGKGRTERVKGRVIYTSPLVLGVRDRRYKIRAEIPNDLVGDHWQILPGLAASMQVHLGTADVNISRR